LNAEIVDRLHRSFAAGGTPIQFETLPPDVLKELETLLFKRAVRNKAPVEKKSTAKERAK
jgi:hypothetical protein